MRGGRGWRPLTIQFGRSSATSVPSRRKRRSLPPKLLTHSRTRSALCAISVQGRRGRAGDHRASSVPCRSRVSGRRIWRHRWRSRRWRRYTSCMRRFCSSEKRLPERRLREPDAAALSRSTESWVRSTRGALDAVGGGLGGHHIGGGRLPRAGVVGRGGPGVAGVKTAARAPPSSRRRGGVGSSAGRPPLWALFTPVSYQKKGKDSTSAARELGTASGHPGGHLGTRGATRRGPGNISTPGPL